jgi:hypothetical protein
MRRLPLGLALALALPRLALAQDDARAHFERAVTLYTDANFEAALVEFQRAYALGQNPNLLYNLGAVYESLGRFVEARDALEAYRMRGTPATVATRAAELDARLARLRERIGTLRVLLDVPGLRARLDGVEVPVERLRAGLAVSAGVRVLTLDAEGYLPREERRDITGGQTVLIDGTLPRARGALDLRADVPAAQVIVDGHPGGETPLAEPLSLEVGEHEVRLQRAGYTTFTRRVMVTTAGARIDASLPWADPVPASEGARISLRCNVSLASVALDGHPVRGDGGQVVPPGAHTLRVERAGYVPVERGVTLTVGDNEVVQWLDATPALQAQHDARVRSARAPAYVLLSVGGAVLLGGAPLLVTGVLDNQRAAEDYAAVEQRQIYCGQRPGDPRCMGPDATTAAFNNQLTTAQARVDEGFLRAAIGGAMVGVGAAAMVVGAVLFGRSGSFGGFERPAGWALRVSPSGAALDVSF